MKKERGGIQARSPKGDIETSNDGIFLVHNYDNEGLVIDWQDRSVEQRPKQSKWRKEALAASKFAGTIVGGEVVINAMDAQIDISPQGTLLLSGLLGGFAGYNYFKDYRAKTKTKGPNENKSEVLKFIDRLIRSSEMDSALLIPSLSIDSIFLRTAELPSEFGIGENKLPKEQVVEILKNNPDYHSILFKEVTASRLDYELERVNAEMGALRDYYGYRTSATFNKFGDDFNDYFEKPMNKAQKRLEKIEIMKLLLGKSGSTKLDLVSLENLKPDKIIEKLLVEHNKEDREVLISTVLNELLDIQANINKYIQIEENIDYARDMLYKLDDQGKKECHEIITSLNKEQHDVTQDIVVSLLNIIAESYIQEQNKKRLLMQTELEMLKSRVQGTGLSEDISIPRQTETLALESRIRTLQNQLNS